MNIKLTHIMEKQLKGLIVSFCSLFLFTQLYAVNVSQRSIRDKILKLPRHILVEVYFKNGTILYGTYENYLVYNDSFWILPLGKSGLFADDAYNISDIQDVRVITLRVI